MKNVSHIRGKDSRMETVRRYGKEGGGRTVLRMPDLLERGWREGGEG